MNKLDLSGRVAIVTGGARGIGLAVARRMVASGASVSIWDMDPAKAEESRAALAADGTVTAQVLDLSDELAVAEATAKTLASHGRIDILVNNAGITGGNAPSWEIPVAQWRRVMEVNLNAPFIVASAVMPHMIANGWGRVVNIASVAGKEGNPGQAAYSAAKAGVIALTKSLGKELARTDIRILVAFGLLLTTFTLNVSAIRTRGDAQTDLQRRIAGAVADASQPADLVLVPDGLQELYLPY
jgi:3-oxoacyl-[acyl-carrier protein] reductase